MKDHAFLILNRRGIVGLRKTEPDLEAGQRALKVTLNVKEEYFKQSIPEAVAEIGPEHIRHPQIDFTLEPSDQS